MSQYPPYQPGNQGYAVPNYYNGPAASPRPGAVTGVAVTGIILGGLGIICAGLGALLNFSALANGGKNPMAPNLPAMSHSLLAFSVFQCLFNVALALTLLICSVGALSLKSWARTTLMPWAVISIVWWLIVFIVQVAWMGPETRRVTRTVMHTSAAFNSGEEIGQVVGGFLFSAAMCVIPILVLTLWNRAHVKAAFGGIMPAPFQPQQFPPNYPGQR